ncbi:5-oxoprolinase subunit B family protein [Catenulispora rubra]|uniref:5-oxoprolinase subunit B family protein n=1 Tax=Catenulispora rubra TaxID=280293 RepID=UPI001892874C|nr:allophanate hydrolase subunit 1 [Catenulispora rubra]
MRFLNAGDRALLVELDLAEAAEKAGAAPEPARLYRALMREKPAGALEFVPAARTVLVRFDPALTSSGLLAARIGEVARAMDDEAGGAGGVEDADVLEIPVRYDGEDLDVVARLAGLSVSEVVARHCAPVYTVAFCGFAPGFGYLTGLDDALWLPRRAVPRTRVPAGSVAIADRYAAVYPQASPGGWNLLGRTYVAVWDAARQPPAMFVPGVRVRFVAESGLRR